MDAIKINTKSRGSEVIVGDAILPLIGKYASGYKRVAVITESGVPKEYAQTVAHALENARIFTFCGGEDSKCLNTYTTLISELLDFGLTRSDAIVAVGGGVVGDLAGFIASTYMRGVDFYNIPTTLLSQVDSSIGGKNGLNLNGIKNVIGCFYQPIAVIISTDTLKTLDSRQISSGMAEIIKMAITLDEEFLSELENGIFKLNPEYTILRALKIKKAVVEKDERESSYRRVLNFGHTVGHAIEALGNLYHGECVALGMIPMCSDEVKKRLIPLLRMANLPTEYRLDAGALNEFIRHDKKSSADGIETIFVDTPGSWKTEKLSVEQIVERAEKSFLI